MSVVLVTGASTPLGLALVERLLADPRVTRVVAVAAEPTFPVAGERLTYLEADLSRSRSVRRLLFGPVRDLAVTDIVHTALRRNLTAEGPAVHRLNVEATRELVHLAERHPTVRRFVYRSFAEVYRLDSELPSVIDEDHPIAMDARAQWVRDRIEGDVTVCMRMGMTASLKLLVLRCAELFAPASGSQLHDYVGSRVCLRPLGYDPMINLLTVADAARALHLALGSGQQGVFNIPGADTLPLSSVIRRSGRRQVPLPEPLLRPLYRLRRAVTGFGFRYDLNAARFHWGVVLDGTRAEDTFGYRPTTPIDWGAAAIASLPLLRAS
jgi:UDP-glucose 4-epimerase